MTLAEKNNEIIKMKRVWSIYCDPLFRNYMNLIEEYEKGRIYCRHGFDHLINTARIAYILCLENNYKIEKEIIYTAALLHDLGRAEEYKKGIPHDEAGREIAKKIMSAHGFSNNEIRMVSEVVSSHRHGADESSEDTKTNILSGLLKAADKISRECFRCGVSDTCKWSETKKNNCILW